MRNWLYGYYIIGFEQHGKDRAEYGTQLLKRLEERVNRKGLTETLFKNSRKFYRLYPQMVENIIGVISPTVSDKLLETKDVILCQFLDGSEDGVRTACTKHWMI
ncbi:MAG: hypothetical protein ACI38V_07830 [Bacteroides sp.]